MKKITTLVVRVWLRFYINPIKAIRRLTIIGLSIAVGGFAIGAFVLLDVGAGERQQAEQASTNLALVLEQEVADKISFFDFSLKRFIDSKCNAALSTCLTNGKGMRPCIMLDANGHLAESLLSLKPPISDFADQDYFLVHRERSEVGLYISRPFSNHLQNGEVSITISRRLQDEDGRFQGVTFCILPLSDFESLFKGLKLGPGGSVTLLKTSGDLMLRYPANANNGYIKSDITSILKHTIQTSSGIFVRGSEEGTRIHAFRQIGELPLLLLDVALPVDGFSSAWLTATIAIGSILIALSSFNFMLCRLLRKECLRRLDCELKLIQSVPRPIRGHAID